MISPHPARRTFAACLVLFPALCLSCSFNNGLNSVRGQVLYKDQPIKGVLVTFHPKDADIKTHRPTGLTKEDGTFTVTTGQNEGAAPGEYVVTFILSEEVGAPAGKKVITMGAATEYRDRFAGAYADPATSKVRVTINKGTNQLEPFRLK